MTEDMTIIAEEAYLAAKEILEKARLEQGELFVVGCSTSEVGGATIGTYSSPELAEMVFGASSSPPPISLPCPSNAFFMALKIFSC